MKLHNYIKGARHGRDAHDLEADAMSDRLLGDALDGYDAVPGDHTAALERLEGAIRGSAAGGRASARARASRLRERRIRGWSVAVAAVCLVVMAGGGVWLLHDGNAQRARGTGDGTSTRKTHGTPPGIEIEPTLPPVKVIPNEPVTPTTAPSDIRDVRLDPDELRPASDTIRTDTTEAHTPTIPRTTPTATLRNAP
jgi:hypothetical protein